MAHDFNNLLGVVSNSAYLIQRNAVGDEHASPLAAILPLIDPGLAKDANCSALIAGAKADASVPVAVGFGISTPEHARAASELADGVVVGTRAVEVAEEGPGALHDYVASLRVALDT